MKKNKLIYIALCSLGFAACEPEFDQPLEDTPIASQTSGEADFSNYVAIGNSLTAGIADGALYSDSQNAAYPNILATQMQAAGGGDFTIPFMSDNTGGFTENPMTFPPRRVFDAINRVPVILDETPTTSFSNVLSGPFNNMGVPGAKSFHLGFSGYGNAANLATGTANPYFVRFASSPDATVIGDALAQQPTFFSLWIGNNDVLSYATSGGVGVLQPTTNPLTGPPPGGNDITDPTYFGGVYGQLIGNLTSTGAKGVLVNVPNVSTIPFFTTVPNNALVLDETQAAGLTGFFQLYANIVSGGLQMAGLPQAQADALASQYAITFNPGPNRFLIEVPIDPMTNPSGFRQMTNQELLLLTINQDALRNEGYGSAAITPEIAQILGAIAINGPTAFDPADAPKILAALNPIKDEDALDSSELNLIANATSAYNQVIAGTVAGNSNLALLDANTIVDQLASGGLSSEGTTITSDFATGGAFSLDGVHLTPRGNAFVANEMIKVINTNFGSTLQPVNPGSFGTITLN